MRTLLAVMTAALGGALLQAGELVPDFRLLDTNTNSDRHAGWVSPRDYVLQVSGYFFGTAS